MVASMVMAVCSKSDLEGVDLDAGRIGSVGRPSDKDQT